jgi:hypothetical protein
MEGGVDVGRFGDFDDRQVGKGAGYTPPAEAQHDDI